MEALKKQELLFGGDNVCGDVRREVKERNSLEPTVSEPIASISVGCGEFFTLLCC